jgi:Flp pilus assembly protein TadG
MKRGSKRCCQARRGTTVVETALVLPVYLMLVLAMIELGHALLVQHVLNSACRQAARIGSTQGNTTATVQAKVLSVLGSTVNTTKVSVFVKDASTFDTGGATTYPVQALKDGTSLFCNFLKDLNFGDELGLVVYGQWAVPMTPDHLTRR